MYIIALYNQYLLFRALCKHDHMHITRVGFEPTTFEFVFGFTIQLPPMCVLKHMIVILGTFTELCEKTIPESEGFMSQTKILHPRCNLNIY